MIERIVAFGVPIDSFFIGYWMLQRPAGIENNESEGIVERDNDIPKFASSRAAAIGLAVGATLALTSFFYLELDRNVGYFYAPARLPRSMRSRNRSLSGLSASRPVTARIVGSIAGFVFAT